MEALCVDYLASQKNIDYVPHDQHVTWSSTGDVWAGLLASTAEVAQLWPLPSPRLPLALSSRLHMHAPMH